MAEHRLTFPAGEDAIRELRAGDSAFVDGHVIGIRDRTQIRIFDQGVEPPLDLTGAFLLHTAPNVRKLADGRYEKLCIGTTTSARMVRFTEPLGRDYGVRAIAGKGGLPDEAIEPMRGYGMVYFAIVGGAAALETTQIEEIEEVGLGGAHARVPLEVPRQGLRPAHGRHRLPRRPRSTTTSRNARRSDWRISMPGSMTTASSTCPPARRSRASRGSRTSSTRG